MSKRIIPVALVAAVVLALGLAACGSSDSTNSTATSASGVTVSDAWSRVTAPGAKTGAVYMTITSPDGDTLTKASVPTSVAGMTQLHETTHEASGGMHTTTSDMSSSGGGMQGMKEVSMIEIPAGKPVTLKPGGYHIMLMDLAAPITSGQKIPVTLTFTKAGTKTVDAVARS